MLGDDCGAVAEDSGHLLHACAFSKEIGRECVPHPMRVVGHHPSRFAPFLELVAPAVAGRSHSGGFASQEKIPASRGEGF